MRRGPTACTSSRAGATTEYRYNRLNQVTDLRLQRVRTVDALSQPASLALSLWALAWWWEGRLAPAWVVVSVLAFALACPGASRLHLPLWRVVSGTLASWVWVAGWLALAGLATGAWLMLSRPVLLHWLWFAPSLQLLMHGALRQLAPHLARLQGPPLRAVVVGLNAQGLALADRLHAARDSGIVLVGCFDDRTGPRAPVATRHRLLGRLTDIAQFVKARRIQLIYLSLPMASQPRIRELLEALKDTTASVYFVPDLFVTDLVQGRADSVCGLPVISVCDTPFRGGAGLIKRASDLMLASVLLIILLPVLALIALAVKIESPGPVIFRQRRYGLGGEEIVVYKFRSMSVVQDGSLVPQARRDDPRVTRVGAVLRRTSLDELPQLINVLQGRMSIVGPRPHAVAHNELYRQQIRSYMVRHKVRPGITGWAQVHGLRGETDSLDKMESRIRYDLDYLRHWSIGLDLYILLRTIRVVLGDPRAY